MNMKSTVPGRFETELLVFVANSDGLTVRQIQEQFGIPRGYVRGTIVKAMDRMTRKGRTTRELVDGGYVYRATTTQEDLDRALVLSFFRERLGGRVQPLAAFFAAGDLSEEDLNELRTALESNKAREDK